MARVTLVTAVWQRRELTRAFWLWAARLRRRWRVSHGITLDLVAAASNDEDAALGEAVGARIVRHENTPLGAKFNAALLAARENAPDAVLIMGSDDFFCDRAADALGGAVLADRSVGFRDCYYLDLATGATRYLKGYRVKSRHREPVGCGTLHRRDLLDRLNWRLWDATQHHGMDNSRFATLNAHGAMPELLWLRDLDAVMVDIKTPVNLWPFDRTRKQPVMSAEEGRAMLAHLPAEVLAAIPWPHPVPSAQAA